jgi:GTP-binding protein
LAIAAKQLDCRFVGSFFELDQLPRDPRPQVAFAGRSNVGKSTLLNKLIGRRKLAKVSSTPGKTRSLNFFLVNDRFYLVDLPGYGYAKVSKAMRASWGRLIQGYLEQSRQLIGLVWLLDSRRDVNEDDMQLLGWLAERELPVLTVVTKADKVSRDKVNRKVRQTEEELGTPTLAFSSVTGQGRKELVGSVLNLVESSGNA